MKIPYYPGCTLKTTAKNFESSAIAALRALDVELVELKRWNCCGTVYSLASDDLIHKLAPIRNLIRVKEEGGARVLTLCSMCYNTLRQANMFFEKDKEASEKMNQFMDREVDYEGDVEVLHILKFLKDEIGFDNISKKVKNTLGELKIAPYYGCLLLRPSEIAIDNPENPSLLEDLFHSLGIYTVDFPYKNECCGAYQTVNQIDLIADRTHTMISLARGCGANIMVTSCPLCQFNLETRQENLKEKYADFVEMPVLYFTQILGAALGVSKKDLRFDLNHFNPGALIYGK